MANDHLMDYFIFVPKKKNTFINSPVACIHELDKGIRYGTSFRESLGDVQLYAHIHCSARHHDFHCHDSTLYKCSFTSCCSSRMLTRWTLQLGQAERALNFYQEMRKLNLPITEKTYDALIMACARRHETRTPVCSFISR